MLGVAAFGKGDGMTNTDRNEMSSATTDTDKQNFRALMNANRFHEAAGLCGQISVSDPGSSFPYLGLAELAEVVGDFERAANFLAEAIVRDPDDSTTFERLSDVLWRLEQYEFSLRAGEAALAAQLQSGEQHRKLADRYYQIGAKSEARAHYLAALDLEPHCTRSKAMLLLLPEIDCSAEPLHVTSPAIHISVSDSLVRHPLWRYVNLCLISPPGYTHVAAFSELMEVMQRSLRRLGCNVSLGLNELKHAAVNIVFGAHLIGDQAEITSFPDTTVIFNLEQMRGSGLLNQKPYLDLLQRFPVWDYSQRNAQALSRLAQTPAVHCISLGYDEGMERIKFGGDVDCDVLFYGSLNKRRNEVLGNLRDSGVVVKHLFNAYGEERDKAIAGARLVLNLHYYEDGIHELVRTSFLLANRVPVVSECNSDTEIDDDIRAALRAVPRDEIVPVCLELLADEEARRELGNKGYEIFRRRDQAERLLDIMGRTQFRHLADCRGVPRS